MLRFITVGLVIVEEARNEGKRSNFEGFNPVSPGLARSEGFLEADCGIRDDDDDDVDVDVLDP